MSIYDDIDADVLRNYQEYSLANIIYYSLKESTTSEQSARMTAMENASKNACKRSAQGLPFAEAAWRPSLIPKGVSNSGRGAGELGSGPGLCHWSCEDRKVIFFSLKEVTSYLVGSKCASTLILGKYKKKYLHNIFQEASSTTWKETESYFWIKQLTSHEWVSKQGILFWF